MIRSVPLIVAAFLLAGCTGAREFRGPPEVVHASHFAAAPAGESAYRLGCADVLEVRFADQPQWDCLASVGLDGRLPLGAVGSPLVEGGSVEQARAAIVRLTGLDPAGITVTLTRPRSARVYVIGPEGGRQRTVPYRGPEPVVDFLWRAGAFQQGCTDVRDVYIVRPNVSTGGSPEIFHVDVGRVVRDGDLRTNVLLHPSDQIYVGETHRSRFGRLLPDWLRPLYRKLVGVRPLSVLTSERGASAP